MSSPWVLELIVIFIYDSFMLDANMEHVPKLLKFNDVFSHPKVLSLFFGNNI